MKAIEDTSVNPVEELSYGYREMMLHELREMGIEVEELNSGDTYNHTFKVFIPISPNDPTEALSQNVLSRVIARYWNCRYSLEDNYVQQLDPEGKNCRVLGFVQTAPATIRRAFD